MYGITNSQNIIQSGGGGDAVYAVNNTGADITAGQKVWLNKRNIDTQNYSVFEHGNSSNKIFPNFITNDDIIIMQGSYCNELVYNLETNSWTNNTLNNRNSKNFLRIIDGITFTIDSVYNSKSNIIQQEQNIEVNGYYLGQNIAITYKNSSSCSLLTVDPTTWEVGEEFTTLSFDNYRNSCQSAFYDVENKKIFMNGSGLYKVFDVTDLSTPTELKSVSYTFPGRNLQFFTGVGENHYIISQNGNTPNPTTPDAEEGALIIYQLDADYNLVEPQNLPANLLALLNQPCRIQYNNDNQILTVGTETNIFVFKFNKETKIFEELAINFNFPTEFTQPAGRFWKCYLSNDMTTAIIIGFATLSSQRYCAYKLVNKNNEWYADRFNIKNSLTLTGFATGKTDDQGRYEVSTVLGES